MKSFESQILEESLISGERTGIDNPIAILRDMNNNQEFDDDEMFFYTKDHLGSIRELVGLDGKLKQRQRYTAYGVTTREKNTDQMDKLIDHAYGFTSRELDSETGLYFYRSRYYSAEMQRFVNEDSISFAGGDTNLYRYVKNNPLKFSDPNGELGILGAVGLGALAGGIGSVIGQAILDGGFCNAGSAFVSGAIGGASAIVLGGVGGAIIRAGGSISFLTSLEISATTSVFGGLIGTVSGALINYGIGSAPSKCDEDPLTTCDGSRD